MTLLPWTPTRYCSPPLLLTYFATLLPSFSLYFFLPYPLFVTVIVFVASVFHAFLSTLGLPFSFRMFNCRACCQKAVSVPPMLPPTTEMLKATRRKRLLSRRSGLREAGRSKQWLLCGRKGKSSEKQRQIALVRAPLFVRVRMCSLRVGCNRVFRWTRWPWCVGRRIR